VLSNPHAPVYSAAMISSFRPAGLSSPWQKCVCIRRTLHTPRRVAQRPNSSDILAFRALRSARTGSLGATTDFHHGLIDLKVVRSKMNVRSLGCMVAACQNSVANCNSTNLTISYRVDDCTCLVRCRRTQHDARFGRSALDDPSSRRPMR